MAGALPTGTSADAKAAVISAADGNPLYAKELASAGPAAMPASITDAVLAKTSGISDQARVVIDQVSVADGGMSHELLAETVRLSETRLLAATRAAVRTGLLASSGDGYAFRHALIRQVIYAQILPGERRRLHRRLAEALATRASSDPGLLAQHWQLARLPGSRRSRGGARGSLRGIGARLSRGKQELPLGYRASEVAARVRP